ncbi:hypothetical protein ACTMSW_16435 [Micromonospora sp. BQ11]|uniref:hypothetical protein n=1 Tax=Micromonospora sp. BQ11 TaxID=3452212 RepID=UPI003F8CD441
MTLYLRSHRAVPLVAGSALLMVVGWWLAGTTLPVPQLLQGRTAPVAIEMLLGALYAPLVAHGFGGVTLHLEHASRRRLLGPDLLLVGLVLAPVAVVGAAATWTGDGASGAGAVRNALFFVGAALLLLSVFGQSAAVVAPIAYFFVASVVGGRPDGSAEWWAVVRGPAHANSLAVALALLALGTGLFHLRARPSAALRPA